MASDIPPRFEGGQWVVSRYADVCAVLADDRFTVAEAPSGETGMTWLRGAVSRFTNGRRHADRRRAAVEALAPLDPVRLRAAARRRARAALRDGSDLDAISRRVPVAVLAAALRADSNAPAGSMGSVGSADGAEPEGGDEVVADLVGVIADAYFPGTGPDAPADEALERLAHLLGNPGPRALATTVMVLVQGCDSTAGLIRNAASRLTGPLDPDGIDDLLAETLRLDPPIKVMRRVAAERVTLGGVVIEAGAGVVLDLVAANGDVDGERPGGVEGERPPHLTFGHGVRPCPGDRIALSLAAGVLEALAQARSAPGAGRTAGTGRNPACEAFRAMHHEPHPLVLPNAWDYGSAAVLARAGFAALGTTSLGVAGVAGKPDAEGETREETIELARRLAGLPCLLTVDIEGGFGGTPRQVGDLVAELAALGVVGVNLEDGRPGGRLAPVTAVQERVAAIKERVPDMFVNARTDTFWLGVTSAGDIPGAGDPASASGMLDEALARARAYAEAGADGIFVPAVAEEEHIRALVDGVGLPLNVLFVPGRHTVARLAELGVRRISCGSLLYRAALGATLTTALAVAKGGPVAADLPGYADIEALLNG
ncbi:isocitrate lyase/phosphoenolpyruvate mutase family protein [Microtetraspora niveoalba]|uniref:isocitrate lyase/phosphoenolpyruvate mutase family protein n=1 Tax=Microtetraspora niveoalba TaxID=46175 RepID=UPI00083292DC|nr:isocitrate lyase/phosphoenolpyruvate mutase family protein [Microtetraspora niveoalba]